MEKLRKVERSDCWSEAIESAATAAAQAGTAEHGAKRLLKRSKAERPP